MAQNDRALFLFGFDITKANQFINFQIVNAGPVLTAVLNVANYTATELMAELQRAMQVADPAHTYVWSIDRSVANGESNRVTVLSNGTYLKILFGTGVSAGNTPAGLLGFVSADLTGALTYSGTSQAGIILRPEFPTYDYLGPDEWAINDGVKNISAAGLKETLVFAQVYFAQGRWQYITNFGNRTQKTEWETFLKYATKQLKFEFTPSIYEDPTKFYQVTLEKSPADGNGMGYKLNQMLSQNLYRFYDTGILEFRLIPT